MVQTIKYAVKEKGAGEALLYAGMIGLVLSDIIPTPADAVYFRLMEKYKIKLESGEITPEQYWKRDAILYYGLNPLWWSLVLAAVVYAKGDLSLKLKLAVGIFGAGAVYAVLNQNIKEDRIRKI